MANPISIDKEMIDATAFDIVRKQGIDVLSARHIANQIGCSTKPIYRVYQNMEELRNVIINTAFAFMGAAVYGYRKTGDTLLDSGLGYIHFAQTERELFRLISMSNTLHIDISDPEQNTELFHLLQTKLAHKNPPESTLKTIFEQLNTFTYGLAMLCFFDMRQFSEDELAEQLVRFFDTITRQLEDKPHD